MSALTPTESSLRLVNIGNLTTSRQGRIREPLRNNKHKGQARPSLPRDRLVHPPKGQARPSHKGNLPIYNNPVSSTSAELGGLTDSSIDEGFPPPTVGHVDHNTAREQLETIRTLMDRASTYRRALAPAMTSVGLIGTLAGLAAPFVIRDNARSFAFYWLAVGLAGACTAFLLMRRQAFAAGEAFWTPPARRVASALMPALFAGTAVVGPLVNIHQEGAMIAVALPPLWLVLYGCSVHSAGFFMPRGMRLFGWGFVIAGLLSSLAAANPHQIEPSIRMAHAVMTASFGGGHLAYGLYLHWTEKKPTA